jgi:Arc/MetJ-type ribon-helix-helix transcriptional regulator
MPAKYTRHAALTAPFALYVENQVAAGACASVTGVMRMALHRLIEREDDRAERLQNRPAKFTPKRHG